MRAAAFALSALEVAIRRRSAAFAGAQDIRIHAQAHRAAGLAPLESGVLEHAVESLLLGLSLDQHRARHNHRAHAGCNALAPHDLRRRAQVLDPRVRARADEDSIELELLHWRARLQAHVLEG